MKYITLVSVLFSISLATPAFAESQHYSIIVDAGSSGSRLHLFQYDHDANVPIIKDIFTKKNSIPLSSFAASPEKAGESLKPLFDEAVKKLAAEGVTEPVPISVLGTAGMRLLPQDQQDAIYQDITEDLQADYSFKITAVDTLPGKMEALFDWLDVNYLENNFQTNQVTVGSIDMGGASTQIAFETQDTSKPDDEEHITINQKNYLIFAKSFLGLGLDQARMSINQYSSPDTCYPSNDPITVGHFNFEICNMLYTTLINENHVSESLLPIPQSQNFLAFSGAFYVYQFFNSIETPDAVFFQTQIKNTCQQTWEQLKVMYPNEQDAYLSTYCANGVYLQDLFYNIYQLSGSQLHIVNTINNQGIDWTLGALLYELVKTTASH